MQKRRKHRRRRRTHRNENRVGITLVILITAMTIGLLVRATRNTLDVNYEFEPTTEVEMMEESDIYNSYNLTQLYFDGGKAYYEDDTYTSRFGVDVSSHNGNVDWAYLKQSGVEFAMIRVGYRGYDIGYINEDTMFQTNIEGALAQGIEVGVYFFSQAINEEEAAEEAKWVVEKIHDYNITMPVCYDMELYSAETNARANNLDRSTRTRDAVVFLENIKNAGYTPMVYASTNTYDSLFETDFLNSYDFWVAEYDNLCTYPYQYVMWQYTSTGYLNGNPMGMDFNIQFVKK